MKITNLEIQKKFKPIRSLVNFLLSDQNLTDELDFLGFVALDEIGNIVRLAKAENDMYQLNEALSISDTNSQRAAFLTEVQEQLGWFVVDEDLVIGLVVQFSRVQLENTRLNRGDERFDRGIATDAEHFEFKRGVVLEYSWTFHEYKLRSSERQTHCEEFSDSGMFSQLNSSTTDDIARPTMNTSESASFNIFRFDSILFVFSFSLRYIYSLY